jgi:hypothetical protein
MPGDDLCTALNQFGDAPGRSLNAPEGMIRVSPNRRLLPCSRPAFEPHHLCQILLAIEYLYAVQDGEVTEVCLNYRMNRHSTVDSRLVAIGGVLLNEEFFCSTVAGG